MLLKVVVQPGTDIRAKAYLQAVQKNYTPLEAMKQNLNFAARRKQAFDLSQKRLGEPGAATLLTG